MAAAQRFLSEQRGVSTVIVSRGSKGCIARSGAWQQGAAHDAFGMPLLHSWPRWMPGCTPPLASAHNAPALTIGFTCPVPFLPAADGQVAVTAAAKVPVVDTIGAGDLFTSGCLYGLLSGASLKVRPGGCVVGVLVPLLLLLLLARLCWLRLVWHTFTPHPQACTECGCTAGTAAVQTAGAELGAEALQRLRTAIAGILAADRAGGTAASSGKAASAACTPERQEALVSAVGL